MASDRVRYQRNPDFIFRKIVDEVVLVPIHQDVADMDCIYTLNEVGALIWQALDAPVTEAQLQKAVLDEYEADPQTVALDVHRFLDGMVDIGAIRRA